MSAPIPAQEKSEEVVVSSLIFRSGAIGVRRESTVSLTSLPRLDVGTSSLRIADALEELGEQPLERIPDTTRKLEDRKKQEVLTPQGKRKELCLPRRLNPTPAVRMGVPPLAALKGPPEGHRQSRYRDGRPSWWRWPEERYVRAEAQDSVIHQCLVDSIGFEPRRAHGLWVRDGKTAVGLGWGGNAAAKRPESVIALHPRRQRTPSATARGSQRRGRRKACAGRMSNKD